MSTLQDFSTALADAVANAGKNIVRVEARRRMPATGIIWSEELIVTAHHVVERDENIRIGLPDGSVVDAVLVGRDPATDLAVLRAATGSAGFAPAEEPARVGHLVLAVGRPGKDVQGTIGIIRAIGSSSAKSTDSGGRRSRRGSGFSFTFSEGDSGVMQEGAIQSDVVMYPGFSGGPLVDAWGNLLGLNTSAMASGSSLTVPLTTLHRVIDQLSTHGKVRRGFLGVSLQAMRLSPPLAELAGQPVGLLVASTETDGPADKGGLYQGDIVVTFDDVRVHHLDELLALLSGDRVGKSITTQIIRGGQLHDLSITVAERA